MKRRTVLVSAATGTLAATAGCTDAMPDLLPFESDGEDLEEEEDDPPDEAGGTDPTLQRLTTVTEWSEPGDLDEHRTGTIEQADGRFAVAFECELEPRDGEIVLMADVELHHGSKRQVYPREVGTSVTVESDAPQSVEWAVGFDAGRMDSGEYLAEATIRNEHTGRKSNAETATFSVE